MKEWEEVKRKREIERETEKQKREENERIENKRKSLEADGRAYFRLYNDEPRAFEDITNEKREIREQIEQAISNLEIPYYDVELDTDPYGSTCYMRLAELDGVKYKYKICTKQIYRD